MIFSHDGKGMVNYDVAFNPLAWPKQEVTNLAMVSGVWMINDTQVNSWITQHSKGNVLACQ